MNHIEKWNGPLFEYVDKYYFSVFISLFLIIIFYGWLRCKKNFPDVLEFKLLKNNHLSNLDGWWISHFVLYLVMGYLYPYSLRLSFIIGCIWEFIEFLAGKYKPKILSSIGFCKSSKKGEKDKIWWYGKWEDVLINLLGLILGKTIRLNSFFKR